MKKILHITSRLGFVLLFGATLSLSACSTGTNDGNVSVEDGDAKDKDPEERTVRQEGTSPEADSIRGADDPDANKTYQKVDPDNGARDADNDGKVD